MTHWCQNIQRDEVVRAAEDNRQGPLPTLEEAIAAVTERRPQEPGGGGNVTGLRKERVTLEVTGAPGWKVNVTGSDVESVRVVEDFVSSVDERTYVDTIACDEERDFANRILAERDAAIRERDALLAERITQSLTADRFESAVMEADTLQARVAALEAASGGGVSSSPPISGAGKSAVEETPVAWMCEWTDHSTFYGLKRQAEVIANGDIVPQPLYRSPPQPRGWLTEEEREAVQWAADAAYDKQHPAEDTLRSVLARSTPPEVRLPLADLGDRLLRDGVIDALAAAGVRVKEVGRE